MFACQRSQIYLLISGDAEKAEKQSFKAILFTNVCILVGPFVLAIFYPQVGKLAGYLNAVTTLFTIYLLPTLTNLKMKHTEIKNPILVEAIK